LCDFVLLATGPAEHGAAMRAGIKCQGC
jgi:hypothetical protein